MHFLTPNPALPPHEGEGFGKGVRVMPLNGLQSLCSMAIGFLGA